MHLHNKNKGYKQKKTEIADRVKNIDTKFRKFGNIQFIDSAGPQRDRTASDKRAERGNAEHRCDHIFSDTGHQRIAHIITERNQADNILRKAEPPSDTDRGDKRMCNNFNIRGEKNID